MCQVYIFLDTLSPCLSYASFLCIHCDLYSFRAMCEDGILLLEANRMLRAGGYFVWAAQPSNNHKDNLVQQWKGNQFRLQQSDFIYASTDLVGIKYSSLFFYLLCISFQKSRHYYSYDYSLGQMIKTFFPFLYLFFLGMADLTSRLCWELMKKEAYIAIWQKPLNNSCYLTRDSKLQPLLCGIDDDPDDIWYLFYSILYLDEFFVHLKQWTQLMDFQSIENLQTYQKYK